MAKKKVDENLIQITGALVCQSMNDEKLIFKLVEDVKGGDEPKLLGFGKFTIPKNLLPPNVEPQFFDVSGSMLLTVRADKKAS